MHCKVAGNHLHLWGEVLSAGQVDADTLVVVPRAEVLEALVAGLAVVRGLAGVDSHVDPEVVLLPELPAALAALEGFLPSVDSLVQDPGGVVAEQLAAVAAAALGLVILLVLPPLGSLLKSLPAHTAGLQLQLNVMGVQMLHQCLGYGRFLCYSDQVLANFTQRLQVILGI